MNILLITNEAYMPHVAATIASVFENNRDMHFCVHILATDVTAESEQKLRTFVERYGNTLQLITVHPEQLEIDLSVCGKWGIFPSLKLYAADLFPQADTMLYMDADMICIGSLQPIADTDMSDYALAMVIDEKEGLSHKQRLSMSADAFYGCAGLVYFNLKKWREEDVRKKCFAFFNAPENHDLFRLAEQDVLNKVCEGQILELPLVYNMFSFYWLHHGRNIPAKYRECIEQCRREAVIIHYIDACKPWFRDCRFSLKTYYHQYAALTPWGDQDWGLSPTYEGSWIHFKTTIKIFLHRMGIKTFDYAYEK